MEVVTIESSAFQKIVNDISEINKKIDFSNRRQALTDVWLDIQEACEILKISRRTLQTYRDKGILPFSQTASKIYFKASDIEEHLKSHYIKTRIKKYTY